MIQVEVDERDGGAGQHVSGTAGGTATNNQAQKRLAELRLRAANTIAVTYQPLVEQVPPEEEAVGHVPGWNYSDFTTVKIISMLSIG